MEMREQGAKFTAPATEAEMGTQKAVTEDQGRAGGMKEPGRVKGMDGQDKDRGVESHGGGRSMTEQGRAGGMREPGGASVMTGHSEDKGARRQGGASGLKDQGGV